LRIPILLRAFLCPSLGNTPRITSLLYPNIRRPMITQPKMVI
jgi:hypothetical protein